MTAGEKAGWWAIVWLCIVLFAVWFTIACLLAWHIVEVLK